VNILVVLSLYVVSIIWQKIHLMFSSSVAAAKKPLFWEIDIA
jgi:hypothetical protein